VVMCTATQRFIGYDTTNICLSSNDCVRASRLTSVYSPRSVTV